MKKNMRHLQNEHLIKMKLEGADKKKIQKVQQAIDRDTYGVKQYRTTREKYTVNEFINRWANPPFIHAEVWQFTYTLDTTISLKQKQARKKMM